MKNQSVIRLLSCEVKQSVRLAETKELEPPQRKAQEVKA